MPLGLSPVSEEQRRLQVVPFQFLLQRVVVQIVNGSAVHTRLFPFLLNRIASPHKKPGKFLLEFPRTPLALSLPLVADLALEGSPARIIFPSPAYTKGIEISEVTQESFEPTQTFRFCS